MTKTSRKHPRARRDALWPQIAEGQAIKIIGLGGVGGILTRYLCLFLASLRTAVRVVLIDGDKFDPTLNTARMFFSTAGNKAAVVCHDLVEFFADSSLALAAVEEYVTPENIGRLLREGDIVLVCVDNHATRKLLSDFCAGKNGAAGLRNICLISGGNDGVGADSTGQVRRGTYGNCQVYVRRGGRELSPSLDKFHPEIAAPVDHAPSEASCVELLTSVPQILPANLQTAAAMLNTTWLYLCGTLDYAELAFDIARATMRPLPMEIAIEP